MLLLLLLPPAPSRKCHKTQWLCWPVALTTPWPEESSIHASNAPKPKYRALLPWEL